MFKEATGVFSKGAELSPRVCVKVANRQPFLQECFLPWAEDSELGSWKKYCPDVAFLEGGGSSLVERSVVVKSSRRFLLEPETGLALRLGHDSGGPWASQAPLLTASLRSGCLAGCLWASCSNM